MTERTEVSPWATREEAAQTLRVSVRTVDRLIANKELPAVKRGRSVRIPVSALTAPEPVDAPTVDAPKVGEAPPIASPTAPRIEQ